MARLLVVDDHPLFRDGFAHMIRTLRPAWTLEFAGNAQDALALVGRVTFDLAILDIGLPGSDGFTLLQAVAVLAPLLPQVFISGRDDAAARIRARGCGARGFLPKAMPTEPMLAALETVLAGGTAYDAANERAMPVLTVRQAEVLALLAAGHGNKEIRYRLDIAERTVRAHLTDLFQALGVHSRMQAVLRARELGLIG